MLLFTGPVESGHFCRLEPSIAPSVIIPGKYQRLDDIPTNGPACRKITIRKIDNAVQSVPNSASFRCNVCGTTFDTNRGLSAHQSRHCQVKSPTNPASTEHSQAADVTTQNVNTNDQNNEKEAQTFQCDVCKMSFPTQRGLNVHRNRHAKEANASTADRINTTIAPTAERSQRSRQINDKNAKESERNEFASALESECKKWQETFSNHNGDESFDEQLFDKNVSEFLEFLFNANEKMPGPRHPAIKFYRLRQKKKRNITSAQYSRSTNPQRTDKKRSRDAATVISTT